MSNYTAPWNLPLASEKPAKTPAFPSRGHDRLNGPEDKANASSSTSKPIRTMSSGSLMNDEPLETINEESHGTPLRPDVAPFFPTSVLIAAYDEARGKGIKLHRENDAGSIISPYYPPPVGSFLPPDTPPMPSTTPPPAPRPRHVTPSKTVAPSSALPNNSSFMSACYGPEDIWATPKKSYADAFGSLSPDESPEKPKYQLPHRRLSTAELGRLPASKLERSTQSNNDLLGPFGVPGRNLPVSSSFGHLFSRMSGEEGPVGSSSLAQLIKDGMASYEQALNYDDNDTETIGGGIRLDSDNDFPPLPGPSKVRPLPAPHRRNTSAVSTTGRNAPTMPTASPFRGRSVTSNSQFEPPQVMQPRGNNNAPLNAPRGPSNMRGLPPTQHSSSLVWRNPSLSRTSGSSPARSRRSSNSNSRPPSVTSNNRYGTYGNPTPTSFMPTANSSGLRSTSEITNIASFSNMNIGGANAIANAIKSGSFDPTAQGSSASALNHYRQPSISSPIVQGVRVPINTFDALGNFEGRIPFDTVPDPRVVLWKATGKPTLQFAWANMPFVESASYEPTNYGVIRIADIPYATNKNEILSLVGRPAPVAKMPTGSSTYAIHLIMERNTAKTMDCFVELESPGAAADAVFRLKTSTHRIQNRVVEVSLSSQEALMKVMFPKAKCVQWDGQHPMIGTEKDEYSSGFQFFVSNEELNFLVRHAQTPARSHYALKTPQRTYEAMISLLFKYPWHGRFDVTLLERNAIYHAVKSMVTCLAEKIVRHAFGPVDSTNLTPRLLNELLDAGLRCPGFNEKQKAQLIGATQGASKVTTFVTPLAVDWPYEVLNKKDVVGEDLLKYFAALLRTATAPKSLAERAAMASTTPNRDNSAESPFGNFKIDYNCDDIEAKSLAAVAYIEWCNLERFLQKVLEREVESEDQA